MLVMAVTTDKSGCDFQVPIKRCADLNVLLERVGASDRAALSTLYALVSKRLFAILLRMLRQREVAEDALQDVFVTIWRKAHLFDRRRGDAEPWLAALTRRKAIDRLRVSFRERVGVNADVASLEISDGGSRNWSDTELHITLRRGLERLAPEVTRALKLCYTYGLTHEELSKTLDVPLGTAKTWVRRGLSQLKDNLTRDEVALALPCGVA